MSDSGLDTGDLSTIHPDLRGRVIAISSWCVPERSNSCTTNPTGEDRSGHGTHVAGTLYGNGTINISLKGMTPSSQLFFQALGKDNTNLLYPPVETHYLFIEASEYGARVHTNSWATMSGGYPYYGSYAMFIDNFIYNTNPNMTIIFAAGNSGPSVSSISLQSTAKNSITVGAVNATVNQMNLYYNSARGPTIDNRIKPDLVAPGVKIRSTCYNVSNVSYCVRTGTSMSAPATAGAVALVYEYLGENRSYSSPSAALVKAILVAGAEHVLSSTYGAVPNNAVGFGLINLTKSLAIADGYKMAYIDSTSNLSTGQSIAFSYNITNSSVPLRVALVWADPPCLGSNTCIEQPFINDLDLQVIQPDGTWYNGNNLTLRNSTVYDRTNNIELVAIPTPQTGIYVINVSGYAITSGEQNFALVVIGSTEPIIPLRSPYLTDINMEQITSNSAKIGWNTNYKTDAKVEYKLATTQNWLNVYDNSQALTHTFSFSNLEPNKVYDYRIKSCITNEGCKTSSIYQFSTLPFVALD